MPLYVNHLEIFIWNWTSAETWPLSGFRSSVLSVRGPLPTGASSAQDPQGSRIRRSREGGAGRLGRVRGRRAAQSPQWCRSLPAAAGGTRGRRGASRKPLRRVGVGAFVVGVQSLSEAATGGHGPSPRTLCKARGRRRPPASALLRAGSRRRRPAAWTRQRARRRRRSGAWPGPQGGAIRTRAYL